MKKSNWFVIIALIPIIVFMFLFIFWLDLFHTGIEGNERFLILLAAIDIGFVLFIYFIIYRWNKIFEEYQKELTEKGDKS